MSREQEMLRAADEGDVELVRRLLEQDSALVHARGEHDVTPLHAAAEKDHEEVAEALLDSGAMLEVETSWGMTPLQWAANMGCQGVGKLLLERGAKLNLWSVAGLGMLEAARSFIPSAGELEPGAAQAKYTQLLDGGWDRLPPPTDFREAISDPFYVACRNGHTDIARFLLEQGADIDFRGFFGGTGLHWAALHGHKATVEFLIASGADKSLADEQFEATPRGWAQETHQEEIAELLR